MSFYVIFLSVLNKVIKTTSKQDITTLSLYPSLSSCRNLCGWQSIVK